MSLPREFFSPGDLPMTASTCKPFVLPSLVLAPLPVIASAQGGATDGLLPPPVRQAAKRSLGGDDPNKRAFYGGGGGAGLGAAFSPDGKLLVTSMGYQGMALWDVGSGRMLGQLPNSSNQQNMAVTFTPDGKRIL